MAGTALKPKLLESSEDHLAVYGCENILLVVWLAHATASSVATLKAVRARFGIEHAEGYSVIHVMIASARAPSEDARSGLVDMMKKYSESLACIAVLTIGDGFEASVVRSRVTGMRLEAGTAKLRFVSTVAEVVQWLPAEHEKRTGIHVSAPDLQKGLQALVDELLRRRSAR